MHYSQEQLQNKHLVLLRPLNVGEQFKVAETLCSNYNEDMEGMEGLWLTVAHKTTKQTNDYDYFNPLFVSLRKKVFDYSIVTEHPLESSDHWYEYHMDILATNKHILSKEPQFTGARPNPKLPSI